MGLKPGMLCGNGDGLTHIVRHGLGPAWTFCEIIGYGYSQEYQRPPTCLVCVARFDASVARPFVDDDAWKGL